MVQEKEFFKMEKQQVENGNIPEGIVIDKEAGERYKREREEEKKKYPYISRNDFLKTLPKDEYGYPIVDKSMGGMFWKLAGIWGWEEDFLQDAVSEGIVEAEGIPEYFMDTSEYGF